MREVCLHYHAYYSPNYATREGFDRLVIVKADCCGTTKVIMPSCLIGEQGIGGRKKEKIIQELRKAEDSQKEIAKRHEISEASVSRLKKESLDTGLPGQFRRHKRLKSQNPGFKYISTLAFIRIMTRQDRFEFISRC